jgi:toxin CcdB
MAKFDVYLRRGTRTLLLDCQADLLSEIDSRFVVPLLPERQTTRAFSKLNPLLDFNGTTLVMVTHAAAGVPLREIGAKQGSLIAQQDAINAALDMLITGF